MDHHHLSLHFGNFYSGFRVRRRISYHISIFYFICSRQIFVNENFILRSPRHPPPSPAHRCAFNVELHPPARLPFSFIHFGERKVDGDFTLCRFTDFFYCATLLYTTVLSGKKRGLKNKSQRVVRFDAMGWDHRKLWDTGIDSVWASFELDLTICLCTFVRREWRFASGRMELKGWVAATLTNWRTLNSLLVPIDGWLKTTSEKKSCFLR